ncbi:MAG TPA: FAD-binding oxidoreductase [Flavobacteriales bacterium]|nr:FAD-binding oxidoreductase [Flavobacteriales bacterium]
MPASLSDKFIIVGAGLAGTLMAWELEKRGVIYEVWDAPKNPSKSSRTPIHSSPPNTSNQASRVAAGMFNPVSFKRIVEVWNAREHMDVMRETYLKIESFLKIPGKILHKSPIMRVFPNSQYRMLWEKRLEDEHNVSQFIRPVSDEAPDDIVAPHGFGVVPEAGWVDLPLLLDSFRSFLESKGKFREKTYNSTFDDTIQTSNFIDCRGVGATEDLANHNLKIQSDHGDVLTIKSNINTKNMCVNRVKWLLPRGNHTYKLGATYKWNVVNSIPSEEGREELLTGIKPIISSEVFDNLEITNHETGLRPASKDRRPYAGKINENTYILNGFGTRGVLIGPATAAHLVRFIFEDKELPKEINTARYSS